MFALPGLAKLIDVLFEGYPVCVKSAVYQNLAAGVF